MWSMLSSSIDITPWHILRLHTEGTASDMLNKQSWTDDIRRPSSLRLGRVNNFITYNTAYYKISQAVTNSNAFFGKL